MGKVFFSLGLVLLAGIISVVTGRNKRQLERIPEGMAILCQPPGKRYVMYALGVMVFGVVMVFSVLYIMDGAPEEARLMWGLCVAAAVLTLFITILGGNMMARDCVYFDGEKIQIEKPFRKARTVQWSEIGRIDGSFERAVNLYLMDGTKILTVDIGMVNYDGFCSMLREKCPGNVKGFYEKQVYEEPKKCVLRYGAEYYLLAVMGIVIFVMYLALLGTAGDVDIVQEFLESDPSEWFSMLFAPVCGVVSVIALVVFCNTNIRYSKEMMVVRYPFRRKREIFWREIQRIELVPGKKRKWEKMRICTADYVCKVNLGVLTYGQDGFMEVLAEMVKRYEIPCQKVGNRKK